MKRTTLTVLLAAALSAGSAIAQTSPMSPGEQRPPAATSVPGETRTMPGDDTRTVQPYRSDRYPATSAAPADPTYRGTWRDRWSAWRERWLSPRPIAEDSSYAAASPLGSEQFRYDGPDQGRFVNPSQG